MRCPWVYVVVVCLFASAAPCAAEGEDGYAFEFEAGSRAQPSQTEPGETEVVVRRLMDFPLLRRHQEQSSSRPEDTRALDVVVGMAKRGASDAVIGAYVLKYLRRRGQKVRFGIPGAPDSTGWYTQHSRHVPPGTRLDVEVKTKDGKLSKEQQAYIERARADGVVACVVRDVYDCGPVISGVVEDLW